jgi:hypothetical protein
MKNLNDLVEERIAQKLRQGYSNAVAAMTRLREEGKISQDFVFEVGTERKGVTTNIDFYPNDLGRIGATFHSPGKGSRDYIINKHAIRQVAEKLRIPGMYLTNLLMGEEWQRTLAYNILNTHNGWTERNKVLVRSVGSEVRAFLSDQFRILDSQKIFGTHVDEVYKHGGQLADGWMDDTRLMVESMLPKPIQINTELNGVIMLAFGTRLSSSDYGDGALELRSFVMQGICLNGLVRESIVRKVHLGSRLPSTLELSPETYESDSKTTALAIRDYTKNLYSSDVIKERMLEVKAASEMTIDPVRELKNLASVQKLLKGEVDEIGQILMRNNPDDGLQGDATIWKLTQGISTYANRPEISDRRRNELQEIAGSLFDRVKV